MSVPCSVSKRTNGIPGGETSIATTGSPDRSGGSTVKNM